MSVCCTAIVSGVAAKAISENREHTKAIVNLLIYDKVNIRVESINQQNAIYNVHNKNELISLIDSINQYEIAVFELEQHLVAYNNYNISCNRVLTYCFA